MNTNSLKKENIIKKLSEKTGYSKLYSKKLINDLINILVLTIKNNELNIKNFGSFKKIQKKKRIGRNPKTKVKHIISARKSISFYVSKNFLLNLNK